MKTLLTFTILLCLALTALGQTDEMQTKSDSPKPDRWRGLVIDEATPDDAIKLLGKPDKDKTDSLQIFGIRDWLTKDIKQKKYRVLGYEKPEGLDYVVLGFLDEKLVFIKLDPKKLPTNALARAYGIEFAPNFNGINVAFNPKNFERNQGKLYPKNYPAVYDLIAVSEKTFLCAAVDNSSFGSVLKEAMGVPDSTISFPGKIIYLQIVSRKLENLDGVDQLK
ncbi:MAG TPA: hypothetical protein VK400_03670 [Pyrinomonadaceae bacterium]|nr:hypothetical protein [Pyrinomonadaceae bacterium]